jgi:hypothetical protein
MRHAKQRHNKVNDKSVKAVITGETGNGSIFSVIDDVEGLMELSPEVNAELMALAQKIDAMLLVLNKTEIKKSAMATRLELDIDLEMEKFNQIVDANWPHDAN